MIFDELKEYPDIDFRWREVGLSFQVQFIKLSYIAEQQLGQELGQERKEQTLFSLIVNQLQILPQSRNSLKEIFGLKKAAGHLNRTITKLQLHNLIALTIPENPNHPRLKYRITGRGMIFLKLVK